MTPSRFAASCAAALALVSSLPAQRPTRPRAAPATRPDTTRRDTTTVKDALTKFLESFNYRSLGPAAYSGRVTALAREGDSRIAREAAHSHEHDDARQHERDQ